MRFEKLGKYCVIRNGFAFKSSDFIDDGIPIIRISDIQDGEVNPTKNAQVKENDKFKPFEIKQGSILIAMSGATTGKIGRFKGNTPAYQNQRVGCFLPHVRYINNDYLYYYLKSKQDFILKSAYGGGQPNISSKELGEITIPLPPLDGQIRIAHLLGKVERLITQRKQDLQRLDDLLKSVFLEMFGDPARNDKGWFTEPLRQLGILDRGISKYRPRNAPELLGGKYPLIQTGDVSNTGTYIVSHKQTYSETGLKQSKQWPAGTLCITIAANIAQTAVLTFDACFPDSIVGFIPHKDKSNVLYAHGLFGFFQQILERSAPAAAQKNINLKILRELEVPVPPFDIQEDFAAIVGRVERIKTCYQESLEDIERLYSGLSQGAFKGDLDLSRINLPAHMQNSHENMPVKIEAITINNTLDKVSKLTLPLEKITERMEWLNPLISNPAFQAAQRIHDLTSLSPISQYVNSSQFTGLGETARQLAAFRANLPTINIDQLNTWSNISSNIAALTGSYPSVLDAAKQFEYFTEQDWTKLGVEWAFNNYVEELDDEPFTMEKCATFVEEELHNEEAEESFKLLREHYEHIKEQLFKALRNGNLVQNYNDQENRVCVFRNRTAEA